MARSPRSALLVLVGLLVGLGLLLAAELVTRLAWPDALATRVAGFGDLPPALAYDPFLCCPGATLDMEEVYRMAAATQ